jgi:hypothetical protein
MRSYEAARHLQLKFPDIEGIHAVDEKTVHLGNAAEGGMIDGLPGADYYGEFQGGSPWVNPKLRNATEKIDYWIEWQDPGTLHAYYNSPGMQRTHNRHARLTKEWME